MASSVQASSLESVIDIASNPPVHPSVPIQGLESPLVLYIARVPGSRDVFLTPMKPRDRVVTAQDVQSALYFVHVNSAKDFEEPPQVLLEDDEDGNWGPSLPPRTIQSITPPYFVSDNVTVENRQCRISEKNTIARKAVPSRTTNANPGENRLPDLPKLPPRPLPAPPDDHEVRTQSLHKENIRLLRQADHTKIHNPYVQRYPAVEETWIDPAIRPLTDGLTLIRRNPSTQEQWNVASIHDPPVTEVSSTTLLDSGAMGRPRRTGAPIYLDIINPSYVQFQEKERAAPCTNASLDPLDPAPSPHAPFHRRVYMSGSRHGMQEYRAAQVRNEPAGSTEDTKHSRNPSRNSVDIDTLPGIVERRSKGYAFNSPWDTRCEFHTGATGNNLKCRHLINASRSVEISELRFNLPTTSSARETSGPTARSEKRGSYMQKLHRRMRSADATADPKPLGQRTPTLTLDEAERVDLSLGQERAGGGFAGRQAKLGKLIIESEGLKMLDLLVAANVGLWWRAYER